MKSLLHFCYHAIFWLWNLIFLVCIYAGMLPNINETIWQDLFAGEIPLTFLISFVGLVGVPTICTGVGLLRLRKQPEQLIRLFYGVEAPLVLLCVLRLFLIRELTPASAQMLATFGICVIVFSLELLWGYAIRRSLLAWLQMMSHSLMLMLGVYVSVLITFYAVPAFWELIDYLLQFTWWQHLEYTLTTQTFQVIWWVIVLSIMTGFSCTLFFIMPFATVSLYAQSWWRIASAFAAQYRPSRARAVTASVAIAWFLIFAALQQQPQARAFDLLDRPVLTNGDRQELLAESEQIRAGLLNAYLSPYRYLSTWEESNQLREMYRHVFSMSQPRAQFWQDFHNHWISPFLYNGSRNDVEKAATLYEEFFDVPIQKAEKKAIQHALQSTVQREQVQAGLMNINDRVVWLAQQQVTVQEQGDWAEVELYEHYQNPTERDQEIFYSFSLPESAVITGVWLGDSSDRANRFPFVVSPRGAAQQVYNGEVERSNFVAAEDPALLEQVGPLQYRLRVFPIPARISREEPGNLHLWMTYKVMHQSTGWALPQLSEKRNIFWTQDTVRSRNGKTVKRSDEEWLETALPAKPNKALQTHTADIDNYRITAQPLRSPNYAFSQAKRLAIVVDSSRSMNRHRRELSETMQWLQQRAAKHDVDIYLTVAEAQPSRIDELRQFNSTQVTFYGSLQLPEMLQQFSQLSDGTAYDAVLLLTDSGNYELSDDEVTLPKLTAPIWVIHLGNQLPPAYDDATLEAIQQTKGGVATTLAAAFQQLAMQEKLGDTVASVTDGYVWLVEPKSTSSASDSVTAAPEENQPAQPITTSESEFVPFAARQLILSQSRNRDLTQLAALDEVHAIARSTSIVTPYSSMLVLVNDRQRELLRQAEASGDRFNREVESGQETLNQPANALNVATVPEPGSVIGLGGIAIALLVFAKRRPIKA
jgi:putative PEP-CTERM system integral membrane protein